MYSIITSYATCQRRSTGIISESPPRAFPMQKSHVSSMQRFILIHSFITANRLATIICVPEDRGLLASLWGSPLIIITTDTQDLRAAKAARVVVGGFDGADDRRTTCPSSASLSQLTSQRRNESCARRATRVVVVRAIFTLAGIDRADKAAAASGAGKANVGRAVVKSTTCPYAAPRWLPRSRRSPRALRSATPSERSQPQSPSSQSWRGSASRGGRWYRSIVSSSRPWTGCGRRASSLSSSSAPITFENPVGPSTLRTASEPGVGIVDRAINIERRTGPSFRSPRSRPRRIEQVAEACGVLSWQAREIRGRAIGVRAAAAAIRERFIQPNSARVVGLDLGVGEGVRLWDRLVVHQGPERAREVAQ